MPVQQQQALQQQLLEQLRDVHLPDPVLWWPPAIGWWLALTLLIFMLMLGLQMLQKKRRQNAYRSAALSELQGHFQLWQQSQQAAPYLQNANAVLKRCLLSLPNQLNHYPASLTGRRWIDNLHKLTTPKLGEESQFALSEQCYQAVPEVDIQHVHTELSAWIRSHRIIKGESLPSELSTSEAGNA